jgi:hypothetical protein
MIEFLGFINLKEKAFLINIILFGISSGITLFSFCQKIFYQNVFVVKLKFIL